MVVSVIRSAALLCLLAAPAWAQGEDSPQAATRPEVEAARTAYNEGRYQAAARGYQAAVQAYPDEVTLYRDLARARTYADDAAGAAVAYRLYIEMAPGADDLDKVKAEAELATRKAGANADPLAKARRTLEAAGDRAKAGQIAGPDGAFQALDAALEAGFIGPEITDTRRAIAEALGGRTDDALGRWWRPDARAEAKDLQILVSGWQALKDRRALTPVEGGRASAAAGILALAQGKDQAALEALTPVAPSDPRMRYAQALVLARLGRLEEAAAVAETLSRQIDAPRIWWLLGQTTKDADLKRQALRRALGIGG